ncbi:MAG: hypothetical protein P4L55_09885 [Syntrophobacteraceae bacterium]|nr:hypothetical protein [Syntrophobacteraceae bacterium]
MKPETGNLLLSVEADEAYLRVVTAFVENAAFCFGLGEFEALRLTLAAEEVFMHLCRKATHSGSPLQIGCSNGGYFAQAVFRLPADSFDWKAFNVTASISLDDESELDSMGLVIASRSVDRFLLGREKGGELKLTLIKEKSYPPPPQVEPAVAVPLSKTVLRPVAPEELKFISRLAVSCYDAGALSDILLYPGKLSDMIAAGEYACLAAVGESGEIGGAIFWRRLGENMVECFGPYLFNQSSTSGMAEELLEGCIGAVARSGAAGVVNIGPPPGFPAAQFELLGTFDSYGPEGSSTSVEAWFRMLSEDTGATVWVHPELDAFIRREFAKLVLPREIRVDRPSGETLPRHSVLSAEFDRPRGRVMLRPMWPGGDAAENIARHVKLMKSENIPNIHFALDLGEAWQSIFLPGLLGAGFEPRFVLPYAGKGDVVFFQYGGKRQ